MAIAESLSIVGVPTELREILIDALRFSRPEDVKDSLGQAMKVATAAEQKRVADFLTSNRNGLDTLISLAESGHASRRLLADPTTASKADSIATPGQKARLAKVIHDLPDEDPRLVKSMHESKRSFLEHAGDAAAGAGVFKSKCGVCHQVGGQGSAVGPNLDGIGNRGLDRVLEDIMLPNRNIDAAFRASVVLTENGEVISGLIKRTDGAQLVIVDQKGTEITVAVDSIEEQKEVGSSPMPANFHESLRGQQMRNLLAYLLSLSH
jgi:putative heme-binding domain-containing protein